MVQRTHTPAEAAVTLEEREPSEREPAAVPILVMFLAIALLLAFPNLTKFHSDIAGNSGDSFLALWIMRSVQLALPHGWSAMWNLPIYHPAPTTLAYSDTLFPEALVHWVLRGLLGDAAAFNTIYLGSWVLSSWCSYRLARRFVSYWGAAVVAALVYTYSSARLVQQLHFQLVVGGAVLALTVLLLFRVIERPTPVRGAALGFTLACLTLTASYYGPMTGIVVVVVAVGWFVVRRPTVKRELAVAFGVAVLVATALVGPFAIKYLSIERDPHFRRAFEPARATQLSDLLAGGDRNYLLRHVPVLSDLAGPGRNVEHRAFPGFVALAFGAIGIVSTVRTLRRRGIHAGRRWELTLVGIAGLLFLVLSFGDWFVFRGRHIPLPFTLFRNYVPGFAGVRALSRLVLPAQLALALFVAVGVQSALRRIRPRWWPAATAALVLLVVAESAMAVQFVRLPTSSDDGGIEQALRGSPRGVVLELPIASSAQTVAWIYNEPSRQLLALGDGDPRVNGYSGFDPPGFATRVSVLNTFPSANALAEARKLGVRYVVLRTRLIGDIKPAAIAVRLEADGTARYDDATARRMIAEMPSGSETRVDALPGGYLVELH